MTNKLVGAVSLLTIIVLCGFGMESLLSQFGLLAYAFGNFVAVAAMIGVEKSFR